MADNGRVGEAAWDRRTFNRWQHISDCPVSTWSPKRPSPTARRPEYVTRADEFYIHYQWLSGKKPRSPSLCIPGTPAHCAQVLQIICHSLRFIFWRTATTLSWSPTSHSFIRSSPALRPSANMNPQLILPRARLCLQCRGLLARNLRTSAIAARQYSSSSLKSAPRPAPVLNPSRHSTRSPLPTSHRAPYLTKATMEGQPDVHSEFEPVTGTWQYIVADPTSSKAIIIDPVLNLDPATQTITTTTADLLLSAVTQRGYQVEMILETHAHADHLTAASYLQSRLSQIQDHRPLIGIGKRIKQVQKLFGQRYGIPENEYKNVFDTLFDDDETFKLGSLTGTAIHLPGHTPDHLGYKIGGQY